MSSANLDPYTAKGENTNVTLQQKIDGLHGIVKSVNTGMLITRSADGRFHSRAMIPSSPCSETRLSLIFIANNVTHKCKEIQNDDNVNVSFCSTDGSSWASYSGKATISQDKQLIKKHCLSAYFGDLKDGIHKGDETDPRVSIIEVVMKPRTGSQLKGREAGPWTRLSALRRGRLRHRAS